MSLLYLVFFLLPFHFIDCKDTSIWMLVRHGTRLPSATDIVGMNNELNDLKAEILLKNSDNKGKTKLS